MFRFVLTACSASIADVREDNLDAYKWILNDMNTAIGAELDTSRIAILGWSAGGTALLYLVSPFRILSGPC